MGNPWITLQEIVEREIHLSWYFRKWFNKKPKDILEDLWRNGDWKFKSKYF